MKNQNTIFYIIGTVILVALIINSQVPKETGMIGLIPRYYKDGVEVFLQKGLFSIVTPPGESFDQILFDISGTNTGDIDITNMQIVDASPQVFKDAIMPLAHQTLNLGQTKKLWGEGDYIAMDTIQFESISPVNFWVKVSAYDSINNATVYEEAYSGGINFEAEVAEQLYEYFNGGGANRRVYDPYLVAQIFTIGNIGPNENFEIKFIKLQLNKRGNPGVVDISIKAVNANGLPIGEDLSIGTFDGSSVLQSSSTYNSYSIELSPYTLQSSTKYAIIIGIQGNYYNSLGIQSSEYGTYSGGEVLVSQDKGISWRNIHYLGNEDLNFEIYGVKI